MAAQLVAAQ
jgi:predicted  nucleic acid-binding Zn-ribbon protein